MIALVCGLLVAWGFAVVISHFANPSAARGAATGAFCWLGFAGSTSFANALFSMKPRALWLINSGYNLVSFVIPGGILGGSSTCPKSPPDENEGLFPGT